MTTWERAAADRAFAGVVRARRRAALFARIRWRKCCSCCRRLRVQDGARAREGRPGERGLRDVPVDAIVGTLEPTRADQFDTEFRPVAAVRERWQRIWLAEEHGAVLPPVQLVAIGSGYAVRDGHHRVSVARARGAATITALVA